MQKRDQGAMIACQCKGVTDTTIRKVVREGASTAYAVGLACSAGTDCGSCRETIYQILREEVHPLIPRPPTPREHSALPPAA